MKEEYAEYEIRPNPDPNTTNFANAAGGITTSCQSVPCCIRRTTFTPSKLPQTPDPKCTGSLSPGTSGKFAMWVGMIFLSLTVISSAVPIPRYALRLAQEPV